MSAVAAQSGVEQSGPAARRNRRPSLLRVIAAAVAAALVGACAPDAGTETGVGAGSPLAAAEHEQAARLARGELLSFSCRACHGLAPSDESPLGPPLHGMFGRPAAAVEGFEYSAALRGSGIVWTEEALDAWLAQPNDFLPGNNMAFAGFRSAADRNALISYLRQRTAVD